MLAIAVVITPPVLALSSPEVRTGASLLVENVQRMVEAAGLSNSTLLLLSLALLSTLFWMAISGAVIISIHEGIHYAVGLALKLQPRFQVHHQVFLPNPSVVAYHRGITRGENIAMLSSPFLCLSVGCLVVMWGTGGFLSATAGLMFALNAVPSCADLYHIGRIVVMPNGTLFANFDEEDGLRTEVATPITTADSR
jgi:hypothetical protein